MREHLSFALMLLALFLVGVLIGTVGCWLLGLVR